MITLIAAGYPVYHSMYDDYVWMEKFGDPMFHRHVAGPLQPSFMATTFNLLSLDMEKIIIYELVCVRMLHCLMNCLSLDSGKYLGAHGSSSSRRGILAF